MKPWEDKEAKRIVRQKASRDARETGWPESAGPEPVESALFCVADIARLLKRATQKKRRGVR